MTTPPLTPNDHERLAQIDELIASGRPSADPAANWLRRQRPPLNPEHYNQLKKEILTMSIDDLTPKRKKRPVRWLPRLLKAAAALALLAGAYVAGAAARPAVQPVVVRPMNPITSYPADLFEPEGTQIIANATAHAQQFTAPTPLSIPVVPNTGLDGSQPMAVTVPLSHARSFDGQPLNLQVGQRVALYLRLFEDDDDEEAQVFILLTENAVVSNQIRPHYGYELRLDASIGSIVSQLVSPGLLPEVLLYIDPRP
ncbi:hypothetical protein VZO05_12625 [Aggregatilineales bacterium SYSU G02658]